MDSFRSESILWVNSSCSQSGHEATPTHMQQGSGQWPLGKTTLLYKQPSFHFVRSEGSWSTSRSERSERRRSPPHEGPRSHTWTRLQHMTMDSMRSHERNHALLQCLHHSGLERMLQMCSIVCFQAVEHQEWVNRETSVNLNRDITLNDTIYMILSI